MLKTLKCCFLFKVANDGCQADRQRAYLCVIFIWWWRKKGHWEIFCGCSSGVVLFTLWEQIRVGREEYQVL